MNGKGDTPRNCMSEAFRQNYDAIDWRRPLPKSRLIKHSAHHWESVIENVGHIHFDPTEEFLVECVTSLVFPIV